MEFKLTAPAGLYFKWLKFFEIPKLLALAELIIIPYLKGGDFWKYIQEVRYPWANAIDFWAGGYWREIESSHLFFGWVYICWLTVNACCSRRTPCRV